MSEAVCEVCGKPPKPGGRALHRDHDHRCKACKGKRGGCDQCRRGLLCFTCNRYILGKYATPAKLRAAADYLDRYSLHESASSYTVTPDVPPVTECPYCGRATHGKLACGSHEDLLAKEAL